MSVDKATLFSMGEDQAVVVDGWLQTMKETNPSVVEKLQKCLGPGHFDDGAWQNLFPSDFQDSLPDKSRTLPGSLIAQSVRCRASTRRMRLG